jgi:hypothetical protein
MLRGLDGTPRGLAVRIEKARNPQVIEGPQGDSCAVEKVTRGDMGQTQSRPRFCCGQCVQGFSGLPVVEGAEEPGRSFTGAPSQAQSGRQGLVFFEGSIESRASLIAVDARNRRPPAGSRLRPQDLSSGHRSTGRPRGLKNSGGDEP